MERVMQSLRAEAREVRTYITQMDSVREACVSAGEYRAAQACLHRVKEANVRFANLIQVRAAAFYTEERRRLRESHRLAELEAKKRRREELRAYDADSAQLLLRLDREQLQALRDEDEALTSSTALTVESDPCGGALAAPAAEVAQLREALDGLVWSHRYLEADRVRRELAAAEGRYTALRDRVAARRREQRLTEVAAALRARRAEVADRIARGRAALLRESDEVTETLRQRHRAELAALETAVTRVRGVTLAVLAEQLESYTSDPARREFFVDALMRGAEAPALHDDEHLEGAH